MKNITIAIIILSVILPFKSVLPKDSFKPWDADLNIGDEGVVIIRNINPFGHKTRRIYNGFQGGAYFLIRIFQVFISPQDGPNCRFRPVCSAYAKIAVERYGAFLGSILAGDRLIRCNPFSKPGDDPVPKKIFSDR